MISPAQSKYIRTLHDKKTRLNEGVYLVEGRKILEELLVSDEEIVSLWVTEEFEKSHSPRLQGQMYEIVSGKELEKITTLKTNTAGLAVVKMRKNLLLEKEAREYTLVLDGINDPGNLGTIIRIADWYGITKIICSLDTVEYTNPKVIMASMGSFLRVSLYYTDLEEYLRSISLFVNGDKGDLIPEKNPQSPHSSSPAPLQMSSQIHIYGAYLEGENIRTKKIPTEGGYIVIGSEAHGIRSHLEKYITDKITIPRIGQAESLNAGVATAIIVDNLLR